MHNDMKFLVYRNMYKNKFEKSNFLRKVIEGRLYNQQHIVFRRILVFSYICRTLNECGTCRLLGNLSIT